MFLLFSLHTEAPTGGLTLLNVAAHRVITAWAGMNGGLRELTAGSSMVSHVISSSNAVGM
jgi:hypothetical protein